MSQSSAASSNCTSVGAQSIFKQTVFLPFADYLISDLRRRFAHLFAFFTLQELLPQFQREGSIERVCEVEDQQNGRTQTFPILLLPFLTTVLDKKSDHPIFLTHFYLFSKK